MTICQQAEVAALEQGAPTDSVSAFKQQWENCQGASGLAAKALQKRFDHALQALEGDTTVVANIRQERARMAEERNTLCLIGELVAELPTPDAFKSDRMKLQMQRLKNAMQGGTPDKQDELNEVLLKWYSLGGVTADQWDDLYPRFKLVRNAARSR